MSIQLQEVTKEYMLADEPQRVLDQVTLEIPQGQIVALRGVSGSGKSTLLHLLGAIDRPTSGTLMVEGLDVGALTRKEQARYRAETVGFVFQFFNLMPTLTAAENVASALEPLHWGRSRILKAVADALEAVELSDHARKYPAQLSGGQQQRIAIARALVKNPPVLLADEPTGALDQRMARVILDCLGRLQAERGCTLLMATHDPVVADFATVVYSVGAGQVERVR